MKKRKCRSSCHFRKFQNKKQNIIFKNYINQGWINKNRKMSLMEGTKWGRKPSWSRLKIKLMKKNTLNNNGHSDRQQLNCALCGSNSFSAMELIEHLETSHAMYLCEN